MQIHPCMCMRRYTYVYTPTNGWTVREVSLVSSWEQYNTWQTHTRGFHPCYYLAARPHVASSTHLYEHTHTYTPACIYASWLDVLVYGGGNRRQRERKIEIGSGDDWLMTTCICTLYYPPRFLPHCYLRSQNPDYHSGGHPGPLPQRTAAIRAH